MGLRIMVMGATGVMGAELVRQLCGAKREVVAVSRSLERLPAGVRGMQLDFANRYLLEQAFRSAEVLVFSSPLNEKLCEYTENVVAAALSSRIQFALKVSGLGAAPHARYLYQRIQGESDQIFAGSGLAYSILRPNVYMQCFMREHYEAVMGGNLFLPEGEGRISYVDARDVASAAAVVLQDTTRYHNKSLDLTGPRAISCAEAVSLISNQAQRRISYVPITEEAARRSLYKEGQGVWEQECKLSLHRAAREQAIGEVTPVIQKVLGRAPRTFEEFCQDMRAQWQVPKPQESLLGPDFGR